MYCLASFLLNAKQNTHFTNESTSCQVSRGSCNYWNYDKFLTFLAWSVLCNEGFLNWEMHSKVFCCLHFHYGFSGSPVSKLCLQSLSLDPTEKHASGRWDRPQKYFKEPRGQKYLISSDYNSYLFPQKGGQIENSGVQNLPINH